MLAGFVVAEGAGQIWIGSPDSPMEKQATVYIKANGAVHPYIGERVFGGFTNGVTEGENASTNHI